MPKGFEGFQKGHKSFLTEESILKISLSKKGRKFSEEHRLKIVLANKGKKRSEEFCKKIKEIMNREDIRKKISISNKKNGVGLWMKGRHPSEETRKKFSENAKKIGFGKIKRGTVKGLHWKISESGVKNMTIVRKRGKDHWKWKNGITSENRLARRSPAFKKWREEVFTRDNWTCQECLQRGIKIHPHHIKGFANFPELRFEVSNGITLCERCHIELHKKQGYKKYNNLPNSKAIKLVDEGIIKL